MDRAGFLSRYSFDPDRFQVEAFDALDRGEHVIIAAPTGSGKTVVAEYGIEKALASGQRAFYTAPIKALSNQKYRDLVGLYGADQVGLLTGDVSINGDASIVVMTTEVVRNMIYAQRNLDDLGVVVLDEVHFLQDAYRGPVWEEVIIHLPERITLVCLSATVSNATQLAEWMETVRGPSRAIVEHTRPVPLENCYLVSDRTEERLRLFSTIVDGEPNPVARRLDSRRQRGRDRRSPRRRSAVAGHRLAPPSRLEALQVLRERDLLPAIMFIFSRAQCDEAAQACVTGGVNLISSADRERLDELITAHLGHLDGADLDALGYDTFVNQLRAGVAAHHAGMIPPFKEVVEEAFGEGLIKMVFATDTLAVGINMPARAVVIDKLTRFTGDGHHLLTPGEYTQLTGRAGRRGIDDTGTAVVLWNPYVRFTQVAELALTRRFWLRSAFRPTYNMATQLVAGYDQTTARRLISMSFAQFQADADIVRQERQIDRRRNRLAAQREAAISPYGDIDEYRAQIAADRSIHGDSAVNRAIRELRPGEVIRVSHGRHHGPAVVVATAHRSAGLRVSVIMPSGHLVNLMAADFASPPRPVGSVVLPGHYSPHNTSYRREVVRRLKRLALGPAATPTPSSMPEHPVEADPDLKQRLQAADDADRLADEIAAMERSVSQRSGRLAADLDAVLSVLDARGYVKRDRWELTEAGHQLSKIFHESDLLIAEVLNRGILDGIDAASLAGLVSTFVYEHRSPEDSPTPWFPSVDIERRWDEIALLSDQLAAGERAAGIEEHRQPDPTFIAIAYAWTSGAGFADLGPDLAGGDLIRIFKQMIDILNQIAQVASDPATARTAARAAKTIRRGVVADSSQVVP
ncbi:MAG: hypothetical protein CSA55_05155 [Ilumatobacter coccineus]|uniref:DEAD/DEAH box helicase n=1 Tax=Ilumatobacter coccineus TaxID=467094 RepID=A0A2G6K7J6_9ACTN|nr:MAG: hypothetical protein CSA55_05155 [Ilumatobacter coccineus]